MASTQGKKISRKHLRHRPNRLPSALLGSCYFSCSTLVCCFVAPYGNLVAATRELVVVFFMLARNLVEIVYSLFRAKFLWPNNSLILD